MKHDLSVLDSIDAIIYVTDIDSFKILYINQKGKKIFGDITGELCNNILYKDQSGPCLFYDKHVLMDKYEDPGEVCVWEFQNINTGLWYQCRDSIIKWVDGSLARFEIATDITHRRLAELRIEQIGELKARIIGNRSLVEKLKDITDSSLSIFNIDLVGIWMFSIPDKIPDNYLHENNCIIPEDTSFKKYNKEKLSLLISSNKESYVGLIPQSILLVNSSIDTLNKYFENWSNAQGLSASSALPLIDEDGSEMGYMLFFRSGIITENEHKLLKNVVYTASEVIISAYTYDALSYIKEKYNALIESLPLGVFLKDISLRYISCNRHLTELLGIPKEKIIGKTDADLFRSGLLRFSMNLDDSCIRSQKTERVVNELILDSHTHWLESVRTPLYDQSGNFSGIIGIIHDITDIKLAHEELQCLYNELEVRVEARTDELFRIKEAYYQANSKLKLLNSITRHDILNQITALYGYLLFTKEAVSDPVILKYLDKAEQSAQIIHEQINFTRLYQDIGVNEPVWQHIQKIAEKSIFGLNTEGITISIKMDNITVYADPLLGKVFFTLVENSIRHGKKVTKISMGTEIKNKNLVIWYIDNGVGVKTEDKERIFKRGFGSNTGLGLFLVKEILNITGHSIYETGIPGDGCRFEIIISPEAYDSSGIDQN